jgi:hypothetical protein
MTTKASSAVVDLDSPVFTGITRHSATSGVTAGTNAQGQAVLPSNINVVGTTSANPSGVTLPAAAAGMTITVVNRGTNPINVYPASGATIDGLAANAAMALGVGGSAEFVASSTTQWYSGAASAASLATGFSISGGVTPKTLTVNNTLGLSGTDGSTLNIGAGGTLGSAAFTASSAYQAAGSYAAASHTHGNITNAGAIGATTNLPIITTTSGVLTTGTFGTTAATFCQGNDSRLSDTRNTTNSITFNNGGAGAASGSTFNGSGAVTVSTNTIGAQPTLVSGTNIKTINGTTVLGSGNIVTGATYSLTTSSHSANLVLTSGTLTPGMALTFDVANISVILPNATTLTAGSTYTIRNAGGAGKFAFGIVRFDGTLVRSVGCGGDITLTLLDATTSAGVWSYDGLGLYALAGRTGPGGNTSDVVNTVHTSDNVLIATWSPHNGAISIINRTTGQVVVTTSQAYLGVNFLDNTRLLASYMSYASTTLSMVVITITPSTMALSYGTVATRAITGGYSCQASNSASGDVPLIVLTSSLAATAFPLIIGGTDTAMGLCACTISGSTVTIGTQFILPNYTGGASGWIPYSGYQGGAAFNATQFAIHVSQYNNSGGTFNCDIFSCGISGTTISALNNRIDAGHGYQNITYRPMLMANGSNNITAIALFPSLANSNTRSLIGMSVSGSTVTYTNAGAQNGTAIPSRGWKLSATQTFYTYAGNAAIYSITGSTATQQYTQAIVTSNSAAYYYDTVDSAVYVAWIVNYNNADTGWVAPSISMVRATTSGFTSIFTNVQFEMAQVATGGGFASQLTVTRNMLILNGATGRNTIWNWAGRLIASIVPVDLVTCAQPGAGYGGGAGYLDCTLVQRYSGSVLTQ